MSLVVKGILLIIAVVAYDTMIATGRIPKNRWTMGMSLLGDVMGVAAIVYGLINHM